MFIYINSYQKLYKKSIHNKNHIIRGGSVRAKASLRTATTKKVLNKENTKFLHQLGFQVKSKN